MLEIAATFATLVSLFGEFLKGRKEAKQASRQDFLEWLDYHRHEEIKELICRSGEVGQEIDKLILMDTQIIRSHLSQLEQMISGLLSQSQLLHSLAQASHQKSLLSPQAIGIIQALVETKQATFLLSRHMSGFAVSAEIPALEEHFLEEDLDSLVNAGLLTDNSTSRSSRSFRITRAAHAFVASLPASHVQSQQAPCLEN